MVMSEPTYRVDLTHQPGDGEEVCWTGKVYRPAQQEGYVYITYGPSREATFDRAQAWIRANAADPLPSSTHYFTEDGDHVPLHEVQR